MSRPRRRRPRGEGSIYRVHGRAGFRGAITWEQPDGTRKRYTVSGPTETAVRDKLNDLRRELEDAGRPTARTPLSEYLAGWLEQQRPRVRPATWISYEGHVRLHINPSIGRLRLADLRPSDVDRMLDQVQRDGCSPVTAQRVRTTLVHAMGDALRDQVVRRNVASLSRAPHAERGPIAYLTAAETREMIKRTREDEFGNLYTLLVSTGLRLGEALALRTSDVDLDARTVTVSRGLARGLGRGEYIIGEPKTARSRRTIPLTATAREAVGRQLKRQDAARAAAGELWQDREGPDALLFTDQLGRTLKGSTIAHQWQRDREAAGIRRVRLHDLRHSAATLLLAEGVPLAVISSLLGHSSIGVTSSFYSAVTDELHRDAAAALDRALGKRRRPRGEGSIYRAEGRAHRQAGT